jgi:hypothetical protein
MINNLQTPEFISNVNSEVKRYDVINYVIEKYNLVNYLEIGVFKGENIREIKASHKDGVDPGVEGYFPPEVNYPIPSDDFFKLIEGHNDIKYDVVFIDGLHHADQVSRDIQNSLKHLTPNGFILLHDCNPISYEAQLVPRQTMAWNGDTWRAFVQFKIDNPSFKCCVVDTDFGVGVIQNNGNESVFNEFNISWNEFDENRKELLNLVIWDEFKAAY